MKTEPKREMPRIERREITGTEEREEEKEYPCVFFPNIKCPIRTLWKLKPESLQGFCVACKEIYINRKLTKN